MKVLLILVHKKYSKLVNFVSNFAAANNTHEIVGSMMSSAPGPAINHLFLNKNAVSTPKVNKNQKPPAIPVSRAVQRLKENAVSTGLLILPDMTFISCCI